METNEIIFWSVIAFCAITFFVIFGALLKVFGKQLKKAEKYSNEVKKKQKLILKNSLNQGKTFCTFVFRLLYLELAQQ